MACDGLVYENCFTKVGAVNIDHGVLQPYIDNGQISIIGYWAKSVYRDDLGNWHMVASPRIRTDDGQAWNVIAHLKPQENEEWTTGNPIKAWIADQVLVGDPETFDYANYAGKFFKDDEGALHLIYVRRIPGTSENGIFAQRMLSALQVDQGYEPVELLAPGNFNSEYRNGTSGLKLLETGNIAKVEGKYVIAYTVGDYVDDNYKLGIAWSDGLLGPYTKVLKEDTENVWRNGSNASEVQYLLQAQHKDWPNYIKNQVKAPGVPSINQDSDGKWYLFFAGLDPSAVKNSAGKYDPAKRRPWFVELNVNIPDKSISETTADELQGWLTAKTR